LKIKRPNRIIKSQTNIFLFIGFSVGFFGIYGSYHKTLEFSTYLNDLFY